MLDNYTLDAVFSLPTEMFYPGAAAIACCMIFDLSQRHEKANRDTFFGYYKDDKFIKRKGLGRVERTDSDGNSPAHIVVKAKASTELLQVLIDEGYPVDTRNADGYTALNYAIENNDVKTAAVLLENGANPFQMIDKKGKNGISIALEKKNKNMISNIVKYAGKMTDMQGNTLLHYAAKTSDEEMVKALISYGIDKSIKNVSGDTAYTIAVRWRRPEIAALLK
jgi:ankyrin repeat protein